MSRELTSHNRPVFDQLHPKVYGAAVSFVAWFALAAWLFFDRKDGSGLSNDIGLSLAMISVLLLVAVMVPWLLSLVWKKHHAPHQLHPQEIPFGDWRTGDVAVWGAKLRGTHAAIDVLLPLAAWLGNARTAGDLGEKQGARQCLGENRCPRHDLGPPNDLK